MEVSVLRTAVIFNYNSKFISHIVKTINRYNFLYPKKAFSIYVCDAKDFSKESLAGPADIIIHSGGDGRPVIEDVKGVPRFYICHSHQWKAKTEGGRVVRLKDYIRRVQTIDVLGNDEILGKKGKMPIMQYHRLAVTNSPRYAKILATSRAIDKDEKEIEVIEALKYPNESVSVQGHPEEGAAAHIFYNFFDKADRESKEKQNT